MRPGRTWHVCTCYLKFGGVGACGGREYRKSLDGCRNETLLPNACGAGGERDDAIARIGGYAPDVSCGCHGGTRRVADVER